MIDAKALPEVKKHLETLANQLSLFENKVKDASEIEPGDKGPEEERERILSILASYQKKLPDIEKEASSTLFKNGSDPIDVSKALQSLKEIDKTFIKLKQDVEQFADDQYADSLFQSERSRINNRDPKHHAGMPTISGSQMPGSGRS